VTLYWLRIFAIGAGYHRYFSHRAYATNRVFQFVLALVAQSTAQKSVLWWASKHRHHHLHSDTEQDVHSPRHKGFIYSHAGWIFARKHDKPDLAKVTDLMRYPELMWLHKFELLPAVVLALLCFLAAGWSGLVVGFFWSTVLVYHATFCINSLAHVSGSTRYVTGDDSRNNWLLAVFTMGEGWHNNHHAFQSSVRQGFRWWEIDPTYYLLRALSWTGLVWDLRTPPEQVLRNELDLAVVGPPLKDPDLVVTPFITDELVVIAPHEHPLAGRSGLTLRDLRDEPFLMREEGSGTRFAVEKAARRANVRLKVGMELGSNGAIKHGVESGLGLAILSRHAIGLEETAGKLALLDIEGFPIRRQWNIVHLKRQRLPSAVAAFVEFLRAEQWAGSKLPTD